MKTLRLSFALLILAMMLVSGCGKPYVITTDLERPLAQTSAVSMGEIKDEFPADFELAKKPTAEHIERFKTTIMTELSKAEIFSTVPSADSAFYEVQGSILDFKKGSGAVRFFIGFGLGNAKVTTALRLVDKRNNAVVYAGNFTGTVSSWAEGGDKVFDVTAKNFAKALKKRMKQLMKSQG
ncbi:MAG: DUF4410 domain-containing protein [bacterium]|nr:DUF4410 domain-containing protein [bacterium]